MRLPFLLFLLFLFSIAEAQTPDDEKYLKTETALKELRNNKSYKALFKKAGKISKAYPKKAYAFYCLADAAFYLQQDLKFKKKNKKPLEVVRKNITEAKKHDKDGKIAEEFISTFQAYQKQLYTDGQALQKSGFTKGDAPFGIIYKIFDNTSKAYTSLFNADQDFPDTNYFFKEYNHPRYRICNTAKDVAYMNSNEKQQLYIINLIRMDPATFNKKFIKAYSEPRNYLEGDNYFISLVSDLAAATPCKELLLPHEQLYKSAEFHANDMGKTGLTGHTSSDGTETFTRIGRYVNGGGMAENCQYGPSDPFAVVMQLMIDSGVPSLGHRKSIMNCYYNYIGLAQRDHKTYGSNTVMDFMN